MSKIITASDLTAYMVGKTLDGGLAQIIVDAANNWVDTRTGRCFGDTKQVTERYRWGDTIWLRHCDIVTVDELRLGFPNQVSSAVATDAYYFDPLGRVTLYSGARSNGSRLYNDYLMITYTYGVPVVPDDLKAAVLGVAAGMYNWAVNGQRDTASVSVGSYHVEYTNKRPSGGAPDSATSTADANWGVIDAYRLKRQ